MENILNKLKLTHNFAQTAVTFEQKRLQKSYNLGLLIMSVRKFSAIFEIDPMKTPADRAQDVKVQKCERVAIADENCRWTMAKKKMLMNADCNNLRKKL